MAAPDSETSRGFGSKNTKNLELTFKSVNMTTWNYFDKSKATRLYSIGVHALTRSGIKADKFIENRFLFSQPSVFFHGLKIAFLTSEFNGQKRCYFSFIK